MFNQSFNELKEILKEKIKELEESDPPILKQDDLEVVPIEAQL